MKNYYHQKFKYTFFAFKIYKQQGRPQSEKEFYYKLLSLVEKRNNISEFKISDDLMTEFFRYSLELCHLESLTFVTEENTRRLNFVKEKVRYEIKELVMILKDKDELIDSFTQDDWRKFISMMITFSEWCDDVHYAPLQGIEQSAKNRKLLAECPLISLANL